MVNSVLVNYFREGVVKGNSVQILRKTLVDSGWPEAEVDAAKEEVRPMERKPLVENKFHENPLRNDFVLRKRPVGVALSAIWYWLSAAGLIILPIVILLSGAPLSLFIALLILSLLPLFIGISLWKGKKDGRITAIIFGFLGVIAGAYLIVENSFIDPLDNLIQFGSLLLTIIIASYLVFSKNAKMYFRKRKKV